VGEAFLEGGDFAEPDVVAGLGEPGLSVGGHLLEPSELGGVDPEEAAGGCRRVRGRRGAVGRSPRTTLRSRKCCSNSAHSSLMAERSSPSARRVRRFLAGYRPAAGLSTSPALVGHGAEHRSLQCVA
jgi:hypothetical protein